MRITTLTRETMTERQREVADEAAAGRRGHLPAPLRAWLHSPEFGQRAQRLGEFLRYDTSLPPELSELAILVTARFWTAHFEWFAHEREALRAGLDPAIIEAINDRRDPPLADPKARAVYDYAKILHETHSVPQPIHAAAVERLGEHGVVELVGLLGYYTLVSMTLNAFGIGLPDGETSKLKP